MLFKKLELCTMTRQFWLRTDVDMFS